MARVVQEKIVVADFVLQAKCHAVLKTHGYSISASKEV
jgi:hypothetical protein